MNQPCKLCGLSVTVEVNEGHNVARLTGPLDEDTYEEMLHSVNGAGTGVPLLIIDMARVPIVDSAGLGSLMHLQRRVSGDGGRVVLTSCGEILLELLSLTHAQALLPNYASMADVPLTVKDA